MQKGFASLIVLIIAILGIVGVWMIFYLQKNQIYNESEKGMQNDTPSNWKVYQNSNFPLVFKYPDGADIIEDFQGDLKKLHLNLEGAVQNQNNPRVNQIQIDITATSGLLAKIPLEKLVDTNMGNVLQERIVEGKTSTTIDGNPAFFYRVTGIEEDINTIYFLKSLDEGSFITISNATLDFDNSGLEDAAQKIVASIQLESSASTENWKTYALDGITFDYPEHFSVTKSDTTKFIVVSSNEGVTQKVGFMTIDYSLIGVRADYASSLQELRSDPLWNEEVLSNGVRFSYQDEESYTHTISHIPYKSGAVVIQYIDTKEHAMIFDTIISTFKIEE